MTIVGCSAAILMALCPVHAFNPLFTQISRSRVVRSTCMMTAAEEAKKGGHGHGSMAGKVDKNSFVQWEMRKVAMSLHSKQDAPKEGEQENKGPAPNQWAPSIQDYLQFLVDSRHVYTKMETAVAETDVLAPYRNSGLERTAALDQDIEYLVSERGCSLPEVGEPGKAYGQFIDELITSGNTYAFICHYYNHYFAHTAGGRMIGKMMSDRLLDGETLKFYEWDGDVKELLGGVRKEIDAMANTWTREQKDLCLKETADSFQKSGALLSHLAKA